MDRHTSSVPSSRKLVLITVALASAVALQLYAIANWNDVDKKRLYFAEFTFFAAGLLHCIIKFYVYPYLFINADWPNGSVLKSILQNFFIVVWASVVSAYPLLRSFTAYIPKRSEPHPLALGLFTCFGFFLILFVLVICFDLLERCWMTALLLSGVETVPVTSAATQPNDTDATATSKQVDHDDTDVLVGDSSINSPRTEALKRRKPSYAFPITPPIITPTSVSAPTTHSVGAKLWYACKLSRRRSSFLPLLSLLGALMISLVALVQAMEPPKVPQVTITLPRLPAALAGLRIAHLSDIHVGPTVGYSQVARVVNMTNALQPDIIVITGDVIDGDERVFVEGVMPLQFLRTAGKLAGTTTQDVFFVSGNHDHYDGVYADKVKLLQSLGIQVLSNERIQFPRDPSGPSIDLVGVSDLTAAVLSGAQYKSDVAKAMQGADSNRESILLAHQPKHFTEASAHPFGLMLAGHTHGGQMWPLVIPVALGNPYLAGLYMTPINPDNLPRLPMAKLNDAQFLRADSATDVKRLTRILSEGLWPLQVYVNRGSIYWGPPMRFLAPHEITLITLRPLQSSTHA